MNAKNKSFTCGKIGYALVLVVVALVLALSGCGSKSPSAAPASVQQGSTQSSRANGVGSTATPGIDVSASAESTLNKVPAAKNVQKATLGSSNTAGDVVQKPQPKAGSSASVKKTPQSSSSKKSASSSISKSSKKPSVSRKSTCTLRIECSVLLNNMNKLDKNKRSYVPASGTILSTRKVTISKGDSVFDVLTRTARAAGIPVESTTSPIYGSSYVEGINNLYEFDAGPSSGWNYAVNGSTASYGSSQYKVKNGDSIVWEYKL